MHDQITEFAEIRQSIERLSRKIEFVMRELHLDYPDADVPAHVLTAKELIRQGRDQEAIKVVREHTAIGILEARDLVAQMRGALKMPPLAPVVPSYDVFAPADSSAAPAKAAVAAEPADSAGVPVTV